MKLLDEIRKDLAASYNELIKTGRAQALESGTLYIGHDKSEYLMTLPGRALMNAVYMTLKAPSRRCDLVFISFNSERNQAATLKKYESIEPERIGFLYERITGLDFFLSKLEYLRLLKII